jgi:hypothetical protein
MARHSLITLSSTQPTRVSSRAPHSGEDITIQNVDPEAIVYLGGKDVSSSSFGFVLVPGAAWSVELPPKNDLYAISESNGSSVAVLKVSLEYQK